MKSDIFLLRAAVIISLTIICAVVQLKAPSFNRIGLLILLCLSGVILGRVCLSYGELPAVYKRRTNEAYKKRKVFLSDQQNLKVFSGLYEVGFQLPEDTGQGSRMWVLLAIDQGKAGEQVMDFHMELNGNWRGNTLDLQKYYRVAANFNSGSGAYLAIIPGQDFPSGKSRNLSYEISL